jgi:hypothetical protein
LLLASRISGATFPEILCDRDDSVKSLDRAPPSDPHALPYSSILYFEERPRIMVHYGRWVSRKDVKYLVDPDQKKLPVVSYEKWGDRTNELVQPDNKVIMRGGY